MTSRNQRPPSGPKPPRRNRQEASEPAGQASSQAADQGGLWADTPAPEPEAPPDDVDAFSSDLEPPDESFEQVVLPTPVRAPGARRRATSATSPASRSPEASPYAEDDVDYDGGSAYYAGGSDYSMLRNPYVLAGLAVAVAIVAAVFVVILLGSGGGSDFDSGVVTRPLTPLPGNAGGIQARSIAVAAIREGPGQEYLEIGLLRSGREVSVFGRDADAKWFEILVPDSNLKGWVPATVLRLPDNASSLVAVVAFTPIPKPSVVQPTATVLAATPTEEALGAPDLELATLGGQCQAGEPITLALRNVGAVAVTNRQVSVTVSTPSRVISQTNHSVTLAPGQAVPVSTGQQVQPPRTTISVVFVSAPQDSNPSNNVVTCVSTGNGGGGSSGGATAVPPPIGTSTP